MIMKHFQLHLTECKQNINRIWNSGCYFEIDLHEQLLSLPTMNKSFELKENPRSSQNSSQNSSIHLPSVSLHNLNESLTETFDQDETPKDSSGEVYEPRDNQNDQEYYAKKKLKKEIKSFLSDLQDRHSLNQSELLSNILTILLDCNRPEDVLIRFGYIHLKNIKNYLPLLR